MPISDAVSMKTADNTWTKLGTIAARVAARLARCEEIQGAIDRSPVEERDRARVEQGAARCPASRRVPGGDESARLIQGEGLDQPRYAAGAWGASVGSVSNVIQFAGVGSAREPSRTLRPAHCSAPDFNSAKRCAASSKRSRHVASPLL